jgi:hypothetical protein
VIDRIRGQVTYANVMATIAVFLAMGGGAYAALKANSVGSKQIKPNAVKGDDADEASFGQVPNAAKATSAANADSAATAQGVAPDSVGAAGIQNPTRSVNLPLGSFQDVTDAAPIDWNTTNDANAPDFNYGGFETAIEWDNGPAADIPDVGYAVSSLTIPQDFASGGSFALRLAKDSNNAGVAERAFCFALVNGVSTGFASASITSAASNTYVVTPPSGSYAAGAAVEISCAIDDGNPLGGTYDDDVRLQAAEFRYTATQ